MQQVIENAKKYVKELFEKEYSGHDYFHTLRVYQLAKEIAIKEEANAEITELVALLHDVDDIKLSPKTHKNKDNARKFLIENNIEKEVIDLICDNISEISYKGVDTIPGKNIESRIVQDADRLDALGALGIARAFAYGGHHQRVMYNPDIKPALNMTEEEYRNHVSTTVNHFYEKLFNLKDLMNTETAKEMAIDRENYMKKYLLRFIDEWNGLK